MLMSSQAAPCMTACVLGVFCVNCRTPSALDTHHHRAVVLPSLFQIVEDKDDMDIWVYSFGGFADEKMIIQHGFGAFSSERALDNASSSSRSSVAQQF